MWQRISGGYLLLPSLACSVLGSRLLYCGILGHNRTEAKIGLLLFFGGMTVVPMALWLFANIFVPSERERFRESYQRNQPAKIHYRIKKIERSLRHAYYLKKNPAMVFLFLLFALIFSGVMTSAPSWSPHDRDALGCEIMGIIFGFFYIIMFILFLRLLIINRWESYMDKSIEKLEARLTEVKAASKAGPLASSGGRVI
jgi:hypothetical protein